MRMDAKGMGVAVAVGVAVALGACGGAGSSRPESISTATANGHISSVETRLGGVYTGNYVKIRGARSKRADAKYPCLSSFEQCVPLNPAGRTEAIEKLCASEDFPAGTWRFDYTIFTDAACTEQLANLACQTHPAEFLAKGPNANDVECYTRNADKSFDFCVVDPVTGAGRENCPDALRRVLILTSTVSSPTTPDPAASQEALAATELGFEPVYATPDQWAAMTEADFASFRAIILGDPRCIKGTAPIDPAEANRGAWGPAVSGNVLVIGADPSWHAVSSPDPSVKAAAKALIKDGIAFAAYKPYQTGAYIALSCYYEKSGTVTPVPVLEPFGTFTATGVVCPSPGSNTAHIVGTGPVISLLTDADLSNWACSIHELVEQSAAPLLPAFAVSLPSGTPYIIGRGVIPLF